MITSDQNEKLPSSSSSVSSSCSSSASSTGSSSISTVSYNQGTGSSLTTSTSSSPSSSNNNAPFTSSAPASINNSAPSCYLNKQEQLTFDFQAIMNDLKNVCGTLSVLARQIDQIVNKMDDKFSLIAENMNLSCNLDESYQTSKLNNFKLTLLTLILDCRDNILSK